VFSSSPVSIGDDGNSFSATEAMASNGTNAHQRTNSGSRSFDRDSRPTSPHNISSPVTALRGNDRAFLSVPQSSMSRQNSVTDSVSDETVIGNPSVGEKSSRSRASSSSEADQIKNDSDALKPDAGKEDDFKVEDNPFAYSPGMLNKMFDPKSLSAFYKLGGLAGLEKGLRTDRKAGLSLEEEALAGQVSFEDAAEAARLSEKAAAEGIRASAAPTPSHAAKRNDSGSFSSRKRVFSDNRLPVKKGKSLLQLMWITYNDKVLILLSVAAVISLAVGLYQTFGGTHQGQSVEWIEGVAIIAAIAIVVIVGSLNDFSKERQFAKLNQKKQDRVVRAIRSGKTIELSVFDILVGDLVQLEPGDLIPVDGILVEGFNVKCDESQATGESDIIKKRPADEVFAAIENRDSLKKMDPFIQSGARVMEGVGTFMVTSTGINSSYGKTLMALNEDPEITPLQSKLNIIAEYIAKLGGAAGLLLFIVLLIKFLAQLPKMDATPAEKGQRFLRIFIVVVTIIVVAVPEGLPLAVTLALAFATTRMLKVSLPMPPFISYIGYPWLFGFGCLGREPEKFRCLKTTLKRNN
jgi:P-type Ca2+ transporter type 2C